MERLVDLLLNFSGITPYLLVFIILLACGSGLPIPEDITLFAAGILSYYGVAKVEWMIIISFLGVLLGDSIIFLFGKKYGHKITNRPFFKTFLTEERLTTVEKRLSSGGNKLIFAARFMPGLRAPIFFSAGTLKVPYPIFIFYDGMAALISVPSIIYAVFYFGDQLDYVVRIIKKIEHGIFIVIALVLLGIFLKIFWSYRRSQKK